MKLVESDRERKVTYTTRSLDNDDVENIFSLIVDATNILDANSRRLGFNAKVKNLLHAASMNFMKAWSDYSDQVDSGQLAFAESDDILDIEF